MCIARTWGYVSNLTYRVKLSLHNFNEIENEMCPVQLLEVTKKSDPCYLHTAFGSGISTITVSSCSRLPGDGVANVAMLALQLFNLPTTQRDLAVKKFIAYPAQHRLPSSPKCTIPNKYILNIHESSLLSIFNNTSVWKRNRPCHLYKLPSVGISAKVFDSTQIIG